MVLVRTLALVVSVGLLAIPVASAEATDSPTATKRVVGAGCAPHHPDDNPGGARHIAPPPGLVQGGAAHPLETDAQIALWHRLLPCAGRIVSIDVDGELATAVFRLANGKHRHCDAPGQKAAAVFRVRHGKIVAWVQVPVPPPATSGPTA